MSFSLRRRHDTWDSAHERARYRAAERVDGSIDPAEEAWLDAHLVDCAECRAIADDYEAQSLALRSFRADLPQPPRDLWARTAAAIEQETRRSRSSRGGSRTRRPSSVPLGAISGLLVVAVVVGAAFLSRKATPLVAPSGSITALGSGPASFVAPESTPITVAASDVDFVKVGAGGTKLYQAKVSEVCTEKDDPDCPAIPESSPVVVELPSEPDSVIRSPKKTQIIVISTAATSTGASLVLLPVPADTSGASPSPSLVTPSPEETGSPTGSPAVTPSPSATTTAAVKVLARQVFDPTAAYSPDGTWFAFSARPANGSQGPDVYVVRAGDSAAKPLTTDHRSVFASWLGNVVIASHSIPVDSADAASASQTPVESIAEASPSPTPVESIAEASPSPTPVGSETFAIDPATGASATVTGPGLWRPAIDPTRKRAVYWDGTLEPDGATVRPALGSLVIGPWPSFDPAVLAPEESPDASSSPDASDEPAADESPSEATAAPSNTVEPSASASASAGPTTDGTVEILETGSIVDWDARWDDTGSHLAVWIADPADRSFGHLSLYVVDPSTGRLEADDHAIKGVPALPGFSIGKGRLAYATPPGQDGKGGSVRIQAWTDSAIGEGATEGGHDQVIVVR
jgi:hypothetical protein